MKITKFDWNKVNAQVYIEDRFTETVVLILLFGLLMFEQIKIIYALLLLRIFTMIKAERSYNKWKNNQKQKE